MANKAYSILTVNKQYIDEKTDERVITGIATTPTADRVFDVIDSKGITFQNPLPLLWQHDHSKPVGTVYFENPTDEGVKFVARIANIEEPGTLKDRCDEAWQSVKAGLVRGVSIGFRPTGEMKNIDFGGIYYTSTEVFELSLVTIPCNTTATIETIKSLDNASVVKDLSETLENDVKEDVNVETQLIAKEITDSARQHSDDNDSKNNKYLKVYYNKNKDNNNMKFAEQIKNIKSARADKIKSMEALVTAEDATLDDAQTAQYEILESEVKSLDAQLKRIEDLEKMSAESATDVVETNKAYTPQTFNIKSHKDAAPGVGFARIAGLTAASGGNYAVAAEMSKRFSNTPAVAEYFKQKSIGMTDGEIWAGPLVNESHLVSEFIEFLRPATVLGKIDGFRKVPFNVRVPRGTHGASANWVGEAQKIQGTQVGFDSVSLGFAKVAARVSISAELARMSDPSAETYVRDELVHAISSTIDNTMFDVFRAESQVAPASLVNAIQPVSVADNYDVETISVALMQLVDKFITSNESVENAYFVMSASRAIQLGEMKDALGRPVFEGMQGVVNGSRTLKGLKVVTSQCDSILDKIVLMQPRSILLADDNSVSIDSTNVGSAEIGGSQVSAFENDLIHIRAIRNIRWTKARDSAVAYIQVGSDGGV